MHKGAVTPPLLRKFGDGCAVRFISPQAHPAGAALPRPKENNPPFLEGCRYFAFFD